MSHQSVQQLRNTIQQLMHQTEQASANYVHLLHQEQQNAQQLEQLAQRERQAAQMIQNALQGHQLAVQQMQSMLQACNQIEHSAITPNPAYSYGSNQSYAAHYQPVITR